MDRAEVEAEQRIRAALGTLHQPLELRRIRVRQAAGRHFADLVLAVPPDAGVTQAHAIADEVERAVEEALPGADVVVHVEPSDPPRPTCASARPPRRRACPRCARCTTCA